MARSILIVEEEGSVAGLWRRELLRKGFRVFTTNWSRSPFDARQHHPDLVVVDVSRPLSECLPFCEELRDITKTPVILLADRPIGTPSRTDIKVLGKPLGFDRFLRYIEVALESAKLAGESPRELIQVGDICLDEETHVVTKGNREVKLSPKLFQLLHMFMTNRGRVLTREQLMKEIWDTDYLGDTRTLYVHVRWLREAIEDDPKHSVYLRTLRGVGYRFDKPAS